MTIEDQVKDMILWKYGSLKRFSDVISIPYTSLDSILKRGLKNSNSVNLSKICFALNIDLMALLIAEKIVKIVPTTTEPSKEDNHIADSGERTVFSTGVVRDMHAGKGRMDLLPFYAILELSKHCENGAGKYGEHNVDKGIPQHSLIDSAMRHLFKYAACETDEDHLLAAFWNLGWAVNQRTTHPELIDVPWKGKL